jgi:hypothetical protein
MKPNNMKTKQARLYESDCDFNSINVGSVVFLGLLDDGSRCVSLTPYTKNLSGEPCWDGWCGETNNANLWADGGGVVTGMKLLQPDGGEDRYSIRVKLLAQDDHRISAAWNEFRKQLTTKQ